MECESDQILSKIALNIKMSPNVQFIAMQVNFFFGGGGELHKTTIVWQSQK